MNAASRTVWHGPPALPLPILRGALRAAVCVIGLGGAGLQCLRQLADNGIDAIGIDAGAPGSGAAGRNGGFLLGGLAEFHHRAADVLGQACASALYRLSIDEIARLASEHPDLVRAGGSLRIATDAAELDDCRAQFAAMRTDGLPVEHYVGEEGEGLLFPADASYQPLALCHRETDDLLRRGVSLFGNSPALSVAAHRVETAQGRIDCAHVIVCVDGGLEDLLAELRGRVRSARLQMLATAATPEIELTRPVYSRYGYDYWQQTSAGQIALGGCRDVGGAAEWTAEPGISPAVQGALERILREKLRVQATIEYRWAACVAYSDGLLPIVERLPSGIIALGAYNGTGNIWSRLCGRAAARLACADNRLLDDGLSGANADRFFARARPRARR